MLQIYVIMMKEMFSGGVIGAYNYFVEVKIATLMNVLCHVHDKSWRSNFQFIKNFNLLFKKILRNSQVKYAQTTRLQCDDIIRYSTN
jgi:hypothetical protein